MRIFKLGKNILLIASISLLFVSCAPKEEVVQQEYNKPAMYWYNKMLKQISDGFLENADDTFTSLESEHKNSPLLSTSMLILANAHIDEEEYELANYYLDEYSKRFALSKNIDYVRYMKIKANFLSLGLQFRGQQLMLETIKDTEKFLNNFPNSPYRYLVMDMNSRLHMAKASFDKEIAELYARKGKDKSAEYYMNKSKKIWKNTDEIEPVEVPFYREIFE